MPTNTLTLHHFTRMRKNIIHDALALKQQLVAGRPRLEDYSIRLKQAITERAMHQASQGEPRDVDDLERELEFNKEIIRRITELSEELQTFQEFIIADKQR